MSVRQITQLLVFSGFASLAAKSVPINFGSVFNHTKTALPNVDDPIKKSNKKPALSTMAVPGIFSIHFNSSKPFELFVVIVLAVMFISCFAIIAVLFKKLNLKNKIIAEQRLELEVLHDKLKVQDDNQAAYLSYFTTQLSAYLLKFEKLKRSVHRKIMIKKYADILSSFDEINLKEERYALYQNFDSHFLQTFPDFISDFNAMLKPEDQIWPKKSGELNTELRIFALMRLGIADCETIAGILEYSANTIYVYKMRIKAKFNVTGEELEQHVRSLRPPSFTEQLPYVKFA
jgi:DNA-binding CsgD family transcriptional regulator